MRNFSFLREINSRTYSVTENGFAVKDENSKPLAEALLDHERVHYFQGSTSALLSAIHEDGVDIRAYMGWSMTFLIPYDIIVLILLYPGLLDNFEWSVSPRFTRATWTDTRLQG